MTKLLRVLKLHYVIKSTADSMSILLHVGIKEYVDDILITNYRTTTVTVPLFQAFTSTLISKLRNMGYPFT